MKSAISKSAFIVCVAGAVLFCATPSVFAHSLGSIKLNEDAFAFAVRLINEGHVIGDRKSAWSKHRPSANEENEFIRLHGFGEYAKWHLGIDTRFAENTKRRYKFPYGDFQNVHRCGVLAAKARARQYGYTEIERATGELEAGIKSGGAPPHSKTQAQNVGWQQRPRFGVRQCSVALESSSRKGILALTLPCAQKGIDQFW